IDLRWPGGAWVEGPLVQQVTPRQHERHASKPSLKEMAPGGGILRKFTGSSGDDPLGRLLIWCGVRRHGADGGRKLRDGQAMSIALPCAE
ncbi:hypothetical protein, partial [Acetobacter sp.]|uniref:hypothetical protein n=1 Tax=Acetobacter sp. TaxID=440 RepID=UPI0039E9A7FB